MTNPIYRQIAEDLRAQIEDGSLRPGSQLRTQNELQELYGASRNTIKDAVRLLAAWGLVEMKPGQGTFIVQEIEPYVTTLTDSPKIPILHGETDGNADGESWGRERLLYSTEPQIEIRKARASIARLLQIAIDSQVVGRHQKRFIDEAPWSMQTSYYPMEFVSKGAVQLIQADDIRTGTLVYLEKALGLRQTGYRDLIVVRVPDSAEAAFFRLPPDGRTGVFEISRTAYDQTGTPMRLTVTIFPTDRNQFIVNVGDVPSYAGGD